MFLRRIGLSASGIWDALECMRILFLDIYTQLWLGIFVCRARHQWNLRGVIIVDLVKLIIDGREVEAPAGTTILQAAELVGIEIPRLCYDRSLVCWDHAACVWSKWKGTGCCRHRA